jgi:hypothetical protein
MWPFKKRAQSTPENSYCFTHDPDFAEILRRQKEAQAECQSALDRVRRDIAKKDLLRRAEKEQWRRAMSTSMPVEYRTVHHDDKPCERVPVAPEGWEVPPQGTATDLRELMFDKDGVWATATRSDDVPSGAFIIRPKKPAIPEGYERVPDDELQSATAYLTPHGGTVQVFVGHDFIAGGVYLRPVRQPFRMSGPGWYKSRGGEYWTKLNEKQITNYHPDGRERTGMAGPAHDLIARATPDQEKILEAL